MDSQQNPYAAPAEGGQSNARPRKYMGWFVVATLIGVVCGSTYKAGVALMIATVPSNLIYYAAIFSVAITVSAAVSLIAYDRQRQHATKFLSILPRVIGGLLLGFVPYAFDRLIAGLSPSLGATVASLPTVLTICLSISWGAVVSISVELGLRKCIGFFLQGSVATKDPAS